MRHARTMGIELLRAALVLALVFLSFAHSPVSASSPHNALTAAVDMNWCGDSPDSNDDVHTPCHACRLGAAADLPPPCGAPLPLRTVADVHYGALPVLNLPATRTGQYFARGPPIA